MRPGSWLPWLCCVLLLCASGARAQQTSTGTDEEGRGFFIAGRAAYLEGRYDEALERFERSYEMSGRAELLYNIGAAADRAGKPARALEAYRQFVERLPDNERRAEVEARIPELELRVSAETEAVAASTAAIPEPAPPPFVQPGEPRSSLGPSLSLAASGAVLATGVVLVVLGYQAEQRVREAPDGARWSDYADDAEHAPVFQIAGFSTGAVGLAGLALSTAWLKRRAVRRRLALHDRELQPDDAALHAGDQDLRGLRSLQPHLLRPEHRRMRQEADPLPDRLLLPGHVLASRAMWLHGLPAGVLPAGHLPAAGPVLQHGVERHFGCGSQRDPGRARRGLLEPLGHAAGSIRSARHGLLGVVPKPTVRGGGSPCLLLLGGGAPRRVRARAVCSCRRP